jgi:hypothetical protein
MNNVWYHGREVKATNFDYQYVGKGHDQEGAGFYFTTDKDQALGYAGQNGIVMTVRLTPRKLVDMNRPAKTKDLKFMLLNAPDHLDALSNFAENPREALIMALNGYAQYYDDATDAFQTIENDFYKGHAAEYLINLVRLGYDGHIIKHEGAAHFVCYNPKIIDIVQVEHAENLRKL